MAGKKESTACSSGAPDVGTFLASGSSAKTKKGKGGAKGERARQRELGPRGAEAKAERGRCAMGSMPTDVSINAVDESATDSFFPAHVSASSTNLFILLGWMLVIAWVLRIVRSLHLLYRLNVAIATGQVLRRVGTAPCSRPLVPTNRLQQDTLPSLLPQARPRVRLCVTSATSTPQVVRLQTSHMSANERDMLFGEMSMLWRSNMQQQLLRARRISSAIDVTRLQIPFILHKTSVEVFRDKRSGGMEAATAEGAGSTEALGVSFKYRSTQRVALQVYWHVQASAVAKIIADCNHHVLGPQEKTQGAKGRKKKRFFGAAYMPVNQATDSTRNSFELQTQPSGFEAKPATVAGAPLFGDAVACTRSAVQLLPMHADGWGSAASPPQCLVPAAEVEECACTRASPPAATEGEEVGDGGGVDVEGGPPASTEGAVAVTRAAGHGGDEGAGCAGGPVNRVYSLVIAAKILGPGGREEGSAAAGGATVAGGDGAGKEAKEEVPSLVISVLQASQRRSGQEASGEGVEGRYEVIKHVIVTNKVAYSTQEIFGNEDDEDQEDCVICLSEPKDTILLPCRHLCVCSSCFARLEQCPVCRSPFTAYLRKNSSETTQELHADNAALSSQVPVTSAAEVGDSGGEGEVTGGGDRAAFGSSSPARSPGGEDS